MPNIITPRKRHEYAQLNDTLSIGLDCIFRFLSPRTPELQMLYQPRNYDSVSKGPLVLKKIKDVSESLIVRRNSDERTRFHRSESQKSESR